MRMRITPFLKIFKIFFIIYKNEKLKYNEERIYKHFKTGDI